MSRNRFFQDRRRLLLSAGPLALAGAAGLWAMAAGNREPLTSQPPGWYLVAQGGQSNQEQLLVALSSVGRPKQVVASEQGTSFLTAAISPDGRSIAVLKRVARGSMPTDAISLYDRRTFAQLATTEAQISFQRVPTFVISWSPDSAQIAVSYNVGRTLIFKVRDDGSIGLMAMLRYGRFQFHPTRAGVSLSEAILPAQDTIRVVELAPGVSEQLVESLGGSEALWSPDGASLAYHRPAMSAQMPALLVRDEATRQILKTFQVDVIAKAWSPDSRCLALFGETNPDPLNIGDAIPIDTIPGFNGSKPQLRLSVFDREDGSLRTIENLPPRFQLVRLVWLSSDWLLLAAIPANESLISDRRGEHKLPVPALSDYTPLLAWVPE